MFLPKYIDCIDLAQHCLQSFTLGLFQELIQTFSVFRKNLGGMAKHHAIVGPADKVQIPGYPALF